MIHAGRDGDFEASEDEIKEKHRMVSRVIFLLNITKVGARACVYAVNLVVVEIPEGVERIGAQAFSSCRSLTTVSFPTTLKYIEGYAFADCSSLESVDLLHTNLKGLSNNAFEECSELKSIKIPDLVHGRCFGRDNFKHCSKLVPSNIPTIDWGHIQNGETLKVVALSPNKKQKQILNPFTSKN